MLIDHITHVAKTLGVPTDLSCMDLPFGVSLAGGILARIETLLMIDPEGQLGERFRAVRARTKL